MTNVINWHRCKQCESPCHDNSRFCGECGNAQEGLHLDMNMPQLIRHEDRQARKNAQATWGAIFEPIPWTRGMTAMLVILLVMLFAWIAAVLCLPK